METPLGLSGDHSGVSKEVYPKSDDPQPCEWLALATASRTSPQSMFTDMTSTAWHHVQQKYEINVFTHMHSHPRRSLAISALAVAG